MNKCPNCGKTLDVGETVCTNCGVDILDEKNLELESEEKNIDYRPKRFVSKKHYGPNLFKHDEDFLLLNEYIGKNVPKMKNGFSWCSFFFGPFYMFYRKMWGLGVITLIIYSVASFIVPNSTIALVIDLIVSLILGVKFKDIYLDKALKEVELIKANNPDKSDEDLIADVAYKGGVSQIAMFVAVVGVIIVFIINSAAIITGAKSAGGSLYEFAKERWKQSKESINQIRKSARENSETNAIGDLYIVFPKGYNPTNETYEDSTEYFNKTLSCKVTTKYMDALPYNSDVQKYLTEKTQSNTNTINNFVYKDIIIKDHAWTMVKSDNSVPPFITYATTYDGKLYDVTFVPQSDNIELCFGSSEFTSMSFLFKQKSGY